jgi:hypothetical protein
LNDAHEFFAVFPHLPLSKFEAHIPILSRGMPSGKILNR